MNVENPAEDAGAEIGVAGGPLGGGGSGLGGGGFRRGAIFFWHDEGERGRGSSTPSARASGREHPRYSLFGDKRNGRQFGINQRHQAPKRSELMAEKIGFARWQIAFATKQIDLSGEKIALCAAQTDLTDEKIDLAHKKIDLAAEQTGLADEKIDLTGKQTVLFCRKTRKFRSI
jgi:hypothetical protein